MGASLLALAKSIYYIIKTLIFPAPGKLNNQKR